MWYENLDNNIFIKKLYSEIPQLVDIAVVKIEILDEGNSLSLLLEMPFYADNPPEKWKTNEYNAIVVQLDFFGINEIALKSISNTYRGNIEIFKNECDLLYVIIDGTVDIKLVAEAGLIQSVEGYCKEE